MVKDDGYYDMLDVELTETTPDIDMENRGSLGTVYASIVLLPPNDMIIAQTLASRKNLSVSDYLSQTLREQLAV
jgi:hypothetical protein